MLETLFFIGSQIIDSTIRAMNHRAAKVLEAQSLFESGAFDDLGTGVEQGTHISSHDREVT